MLKTIKPRSCGNHQWLQSAWGESCLNSFGPSGFRIHDTGILEQCTRRAEHQQGPTGLTHPCGGFLSSQPALMTCVVGAGPPGNRSMGWGGSWGIRRLLGKGELRWLVCHPPLEEEERE